MTHVAKSALLLYQPEQIFALVEQVELYPQFLPWCKSTEVHERNADGMRASIEMGLAGFRYVFSTTNRHVYPQRIELGLTPNENRLAPSAFSSLQGAWQFVRLGDQGCKVGLTLEYQFMSATVGRLIGPLFDQAASTLMDRFVQRADAIYG